MAMFDFSELCLADLGTADFGAITKTFSRIFLLNVPILTPEDRGAAKRLIWFVDEAYENEVELVVLADSKPDEIYTHGIGHKAFKRTASRLSEIF
jgi:cell division protein ZapE